MAFAGGCSGTNTQATPSPSPGSNAALLDVYAALGDGLSAGMVSSALVESHQAYSFPAQIARVGGTQTFQQPRISRPGIPPELELRRFFPAPSVIEPSATQPGAALNADLSGPFNNLGVPGATVRDLVSATGAKDSYHGLVLRSLGTALTQGGRLRPSLVTLWIGNSDVLKAVVTARAIEGVTLTRPEDFEKDFSQAVTTLQQNTSATIVAANIPDFTTAPFVTAIKPYVVDPATGQAKLTNGLPIPLIGPSGTPLPASSSVTLAASHLIAAGQGIPVSEGGLGTPLPDEVVLDKTEADIIRDHVAAYNRSIAKVCSTASVPLVDMKAVFDEFATTGRNLGGTVLTSAFLTGGVFSYDGVYPTDLGYSVLANEWIRVINENGGGLPYINLSPIMSARESPVASPTPEVIPFVFTKAALANLLSTLGSVGSN